MKIINRIKTLWNSYIAKPWVVVPNIYFLRFHYLFLIFFILGLSLSYSKWIYLDGNPEFRDLIALNFTTLLPNLFIIISGLYILGILNKRFPYDNIPASIFIFVFAILGAIHAYFVDSLQIELETFKPNEYELSYKNFKIAVDLGDLLFGLVFGIILSLVLLYYTKFCESELKERLKIYNERKNLHEEIDQIEDEIYQFEDLAEKRIYSEVLDKMNLQELVRKIGKSANNADLEKYLRVKIIQKIRIASSSLLEPSKQKKATKKIVEVRNFINSNQFVLRPNLFAFIFLIITLVSYASINAPGSTQSLILNSLFCGFLLHLINRYFLSRLEKNYLNFNISIFVASLLALLSGVLDVFNNHSFPLELRFFRFILFIILINSLSFTSNLNLPRHIVNKKQDSVSEMRIRVEYLKYTLDAMEREIAEHLHGYLVLQMSSLASRVKDIDLDDKNLDLIAREIRQSFSYENFSTLKRNLSLDADSLNRLASDWHGLMEVTFHGDLHNLTLVPITQRRECWNVVIELVNNAYRHGMATEIDIEIKFTSKKIMVLVATNNGRPIRTDVLKGIGTSILEMASDGNWSIRNHENGGVVVKAQINLYAQARVFSSREKIISW